jgi:hypothetical protein
MRLPYRNGLLECPRLASSSTNSALSKQFEQVGDGVIGRGVFARNMASKDGLRLKDRLDQYGIIHLALAPFAHPRRQLLAKAAIAASRVAA